METDTLSYLDIDYSPHTSILFGYMSVLPVEQETEVNLILPITFKRETETKPRIGFI